jgi:hypothetical protein
MSPRFIHIPVVGSDRKVQARETTKRTVCTAIGEARFARDHELNRDSAAMMSSHHAIGKILMLQIAAHALKRQNMKEKYR